MVKPPQTILLALGNFCAFTGLCQTSLPKPHRMISKVLDRVHVVTRSRPIGEEQSSALKFLMHGSFYTSISTIMHGSLARQTACLKGGAQTRSPCGPHRNSRHWDQTRALYLWLRLRHQRRVSLNTSNAVMLAQRSAKCPHKHLS